MLFGPSEVSNLYFSPPVSCVWYSRTNQDRFSSSFHVIVDGREEVPVLTVDVISGVSEVINLLDVVEGCKS